MTASRAAAGNAGRGPYIRHEAACRRPCTGWFQRHQPVGFRHAEALHFRTPCTACLHPLQGVFQLHWSKSRMAAATLIRRSQLRGDSRAHSTELRIAGSGRLPAVEKQRAVEALGFGGELPLNVQPAAPGARSQCPDRRTHRTDAQRCEAAINRTVTATGLCRDAPSRASGWQRKPLSGPGPLTGPASPVICHASRDSGN